MIASEILPEDIMDMKVLEMAVPLDRYLRLDDHELDALDGIEPPPESSGLDEPVAAAVPEAAAAGPEEDERSDDADPVHDSDGSGPGPDEAGPDSPDPADSIDEAGPDSPDPGPDDVGSDASSSYSNSSDSSSS